MKSKCWRQSLLPPVSIIIIMIDLIIAPPSILSEDEWGDLECLYKACQAAITDGGLFTDAGVDERGENERWSENYCEMKTIKGPENRQLVGANKTKEERIVQREKCLSLE